MGFIGGWLTEINDGISSSSTPGDLYGERLYYGDYPYGGNPQYNGNIADQKVSIAGFGEHMAYLYDAADRLRIVAREDDTSGFQLYEDYEYDENGNRMLSRRFEGGITQADYIYDLPNSPNRLIGITNADTNSYDYDANGNIILDSVKQARMNYDIFNRLEEVKFAQPLSEDSNRLWFGYNNDDLRVIKTYSFWYEESLDSTVDPGDPPGGGGTMSLVPHMKCGFLLFL